MSATVGYATLQIIPSAKGFGSAVSGQVQGDLASAGKKGGEAAGKGFSGGILPPVRALAGPLAAVFAIGKAKDFLSGAIAQASDMNEAGTKLQQVFQGATGQVLDFASKGAKGLGQSNLDVQNAAASFGIYGKAAGLAGAANADFSTQLVQLSTDLGSFYNTDPSQAAAAIAAGLRGESEPLRQYGVLLDDASLRTEALKEGLIKTTTQALTPQQRVLAAHALILKQTTVAQGDFARTSGGLANQQRILSAQTANLKGKIGGALLPVMVGLGKLATGTLLPALSGLTSSLGGFARAIPTPILKAAALAVFGLGIALVTIKAYTLAQAAATTLWTAAQGIAAVASDVFAVSIRLVNAAMAANPIGLVIVALLALGAGLVLAYNKSATFRAIVTGALDAVKGAASAVATFFTKDIPAAFQAALAFLTRWGPTALAVLVPFIGIPLLIAQHFAAIKGYLTAAFSAAYSAVAGGVGNIIGAVASIPGKILGFATSVRNAGSRLMSGLFDGIKSAVTNAGGFAADIAGSIKNAINDVLHLPIVLPKVNTHIPGVGTVGGETLLPRLAKGGVVPRTPGGRLAVIGEGAEDEAVMPLSQLGRFVKGGNGQTAAPSADVADALEQIRGAIAEGLDGFRKEIRYQTDRHVRLTQTGALRR